MPSIGAIGKYATFYLWRSLEDRAEISTDELA